MLFWKPPSNVCTIMKKFPGHVSGTCCSDTSYRACWHFFTCATSGSVQTLTPETLKRKLILETSFKTVSFLPWDEVLTPGQTDSQVVASWKLAWSTCDSAWPGLTSTCVDLRWLAITLVEIKCKFFTVWPPNASLFASSTCRYLRLLATTCESVWPGL